MDAAVEAAAMVAAKGWNFFYILTAVNTILIKKINSSNKKFKCHYCLQTSNKKSNIKIHIQRKHKKQMECNKYDSQVYQNKIQSQNTETRQIDMINSFQQPSSLFNTRFNSCNEYYNFEIEKEEEEKERKRKVKEDTMICFWCIVNFVQDNIK